METDRLLVDQALLAEGTSATEESVEVDRDAVLLSLGVARQVEGACPAPARHVYQMFSVVDAQIVDIRAYLTGPAPSPAVEARF